MAETRNQNGIGVKCILFCWHQIDSMQSNSSKFSEWLSLIVLQIYDTWKTSQPVGLLAHSSNNLGLVLTSGSICGVCMLPCNYVRFPRCLREFNGKWWWIELNKCEWLAWTLSWRATFLYSPRCNKRVFICICPKSPLQLYLCLHTWKKCTTSKLIKWQLIWWKMEIPEHITQWPGHLGTYTHCLTFWYEATCSPMPECPPK